ncbi:Mannose-1-phosphate guanylyltransferase/mannose-6-phosphate isomerase [Candidatus Syntrophocurvum alkaliphilum]|uniref:Mannose-1-phosphate guanylyltransferase/mannose-6-phosphate isomerase n=1 Tax=Candidatus Syntrophocurvum alkaliphilum TaxID=2293317 RepID=A0A6I6DD55_9FIRM|nr:sugar phosphate nucleotidyltransferase [Candidatus Syntrophocurvum alkaliphilum]QGU00120.1 Mannose-1-phosphate guanylyltransferase/mannose-6-phosphate isomerase [Candidatus Syntrophocurvum alkaliphilum]
MISVILAGGKGLRLWPESRQVRPKQLCKFIDNRSMLDHTIDRLTYAGSDKIIIITSEDLQESIESVINQRPDSHKIEVLSEPEGRNTAPAVGLALSKYATMTDEVMGIFPADHHVMDSDGFKDTLQKAIEAARKGHLATVGISPNRPETGYGYIEKTKWEIGQIPDVYEVKSFCEKPDIETAQSYLSNGKHLWNAGIYIGLVDTFVKEFENHLPDIYGRFSSGLDNYLQSYSNLPDISIDYGIAEKCKRMAVVSGNFGWCDLGSWTALSELYEPDNDQNICTGEDIIVLNSKNCIVKQQEKTVVLYGVNDLLLVETDDVIFISDKNKSQEVRSIVNNLQEQMRHDLI